MTPQCLSYWCLQVVCSASTAITQHSSPLRSEGAGSVCFRGCSTAQTDCLSEPLSLHCLARQQEWGGTPTPESQESELYVALALPLINCWDPEQVTVFSSNLKLSGKRWDADSVGNTWQGSYKTHWLRPHPTGSSDQCIRFCFVFKRRGFCCTFLAKRHWAVCY